MHSLKWEKNLRNYTEVEAHREKVPVSKYTELATSVEFFREVMTENT
jgi:hypothetical protein